MHSNTLQNIEGYEFSENQKNVWHEGHPGPEVFYHQVTLRLNVPITPAQLLESIRLVVRNHEILTFRTHQRKNYRTPIQFQPDGHAIDFLVVEAADERREELLESQLNKPYAPSADEPVRFCLIRENECITQLYVRIYALWADTYSSVFFCRELAKAMGATAAYGEEVIEKIDYVNYAAWQNELIRTPEEEAAAFWKTYHFAKNQQIEPFAGEAGPAFRPGRMVIEEIAESRYQELLQYCAENELQPEDVLLTRYVAYLASFGNADITLGYVPYDRSYPELNDTLGLVTKTIPVSVSTAGMQWDKTATAELRKQIGLVEGWADYFSAGRENAPGDQDQTRFNYCFEYIGLGEPDAPGGSPLTINDVYAVGSKFRLKLCCTDDGAKVSIALYYDQASYSPQSLALIAGQLKQYYGAVAGPGIPGLSPAEEAFIGAVNATATSYGPAPSILALYEQHVRTTPGAVALQYLDREITYRELDAKVNQFAHYLVQAAKVTEGDPVGILLERSEAFVISVLAVLKAGAYYIPIEWGYPQEKVHFILTDCRCKVLVSNLPPTTLAGVADLTIIHPGKEDIQTYPSDALPAIPTPAHTAYCIYTSGSTGNPKGCLISHANLLHYIRWANAFYFTDPTKGNWGCLTSVSFDLTVTSLFTSLTRGKKLTLFPESKDISELLRESFGDPGVDTLKLTPAHLSLLRELGIGETNVEIVICGGEQLTKNQVDALRAIKPTIRLFNEYGPTETTVGCIVKEVFDEELIAIGKPIANTTVVLLDANHQPAPVGNVGEILIGGAGLSGGYLNCPELTAGRFIRYAWQGQEQAFYRTGDMGRWLPDGNLVYLGRNDHQVKIRGYRVELGEIEHHLLQKENIREAVVVARTSPTGETLLAAYVTSPQEQQEADLQSHLLARLPEYMLPACYVQLEAMPLTGNGKIDRKALPDPDGARMGSGVEYVAPGTETETRLAAIWEELLQKDRIGIKDNFFLAGGNSLRAMTILNHIYKSFNVRLQLKDFFKAATIEDVAREIDVALNVRSLQNADSNVNFESEILI